MTQNEMNAEMVNISKFLSIAGIKKTGPVITATFGVENTDGQVYIDMEILIPLDKEVVVPEPYVFKKLFHLKNAVYSRHGGNPQYLQNTLSEMMEFIKDKKLSQITSVYSVNVKELMQGETIDNMITDLYIGVNPSVL